MAFAWAGPMAISRLADADSYIKGPKGQLLLHFSYFFEYLAASAAESREKGMGHFKIGEG